MDECFAQGDMERAAGMPVQMLNDSEKVCRPYVQVAWISHVVLPMSEVVMYVLPPLWILMEHLSRNYEKWMSLFQQEAKPTQDEAWHQAERIRMIAAHCAELRTDACWDVEVAL